ncbi:MAG TPA: biotin--[acetyl-CoA-carboxylase] ligase [Candidatus Gallacutalibacter stercoravium]|nr:biotin--[acetyl-CoA-carboxylase] ligase [Candidatus Gallacutalibacter stercoravium]
MQTMQSQTMRNQILQSLRASDQYLSGEQLSRQFQVTRSAVWKAIQSLREEGYQIESVTNRGYRLLSLPDRLLPVEIQQGLQTQQLGGQIIYCESVNSTNEKAKLVAAEGATHGTVIVAEKQTSGKGRLGRVWSSPASQGIWMSILLKPDILPKDIATITLITGLAVCRAINSICDCKAQIKWPNDIIIGTRKVCGILTELAAEAERVNYVVAGIGINVNNTSFPAALTKKATSLRMEFGKSFSRVALVQAVLQELEPIYNRFVATLSFQDFDAYKEKCATLGRKVTLVQNQLELHGTAVDLTPTGELIVRLEDGKNITVNSGEVLVQGIYE